jgi:RNA polymerase sigma-70 factor (ECF subfamily)
MASPLPTVVIPAAVLASTDSLGVQTAPLDLASIYRSHGAAVARWAARLAGPGLDPEDLVQEVFMIAQRKLSGWRGESSLARWLYRITERVVWHRRRKLRLERSRWHRFLWGGAEIDAGAAPGPQPSPLEVAQSRQAATLFYRALEGMNENHRAAFILFELEELPGAEIALLKGVAIGTVWVWLHRARAHFLTRVAELEAQP